MLREFPDIGYHYRSGEDGEVRILLYGHYRIAYCGASSAISWTCWAFSMARWTWTGIFREHPASERGRSDEQRLSLSIHNSPIHHSLWLEGQVDATSGVGDEQDAPNPTQMVILRSQMMTSEHGSPPVCIGGAGITIENDIVLGPRYLPAVRRQLSPESP